MKKIIYGTAITAQGAAMTMLFWSIMAAFFEAEQSALDTISSSVNLVTWVPVAVYLVSAVATSIRFRARYDQMSYQPLRKPVAILVSFVTQTGLFAVLGKPSNVHGQASTAFVIALILSLILGVFSLATAFVLGRPILGSTKLPFSGNE